MNYWNYYLIFAVVVILLDVWIYFYKNNFKPLNYFLVFIMTFAHPLFILLAFNCVQIFGKILGIINQIFNSNMDIELDSGVGIIFMLIFYMVSMILFAMLRYKFHKSRLDDFNLYDFSKFHFFNIAFVPIYVYIIHYAYTKNDEILAIFVLGILPILSVIAIFYSMIKTLIIKLIERKKNV